MANLNSKLEVDENNRIGLLGPAGDEWWYN